MIHRIGQFLCRIPCLRRFLVKSWYQYLADKCTDRDWTCMNHGYASLDTPDGKTELRLDPSREHERYSLQLYHHVAESADLTGKDVLEIGCGRGGGAACLHAARQPRTIVGVDISARAIALCNDTHTRDGLSYKVGDAEKLPFQDGVFDILVNVESAHCYRSMDRFLKEVRRTLRPGGTFLFADGWPANDERILRQQLERSGLVLIHEEDITRNVLRALELDQERKQALIQAHTPRFLASSLRGFAGAEGSRVRHELSTGRKRYLKIVLQKPAPVNR